MLFIWNPIDSKKLKKNYKKKKIKDMSSYFFNWINVKGKKQHLQTEYLKLLKPYV